MSAFSDAEKAKIYEYFGWPPGTSDIDPALKNAIVRIELISDGDATKARVQDHLTAIGNVVTAARNATLNTEADTINKLRVDPARGMLAMFISARIEVSALEGIFGVPRKRDIFNVYT